MIPEFYIKDYYLLIRLDAYHRVSKIYGHYTAMKVIRWHIYHRESCDAANFIISRLKDAQTNPEIGELEQSEYMELSKIISRCGVSNDNVGLTFFMCLWNSNTKLILESLSARSDISPHYIEIVKNMSKVFRKKILEKISV